MSVIFSRAPLRVSLGGGGTDLPSYYREHEGFLVAGAIDKYVYMLIHTVFQRRYKIVLDAVPKDLHLLIGGRGELGQVIIAEVLLDVVAGAHQQPHDRGRPGQEHDGHGPLAGPDGPDRVPQPGSRVDRHSRRGHQADGELDPGVAAVACPSDVLSHGAYLLPELRDA